MYFLRRLDLLVTEVCVPRVLAALAIALGTGVVINAGGARLFVHALDIVFGLLMKWEVLGVLRNLRNERALSLLPVFAVMILAVPLTFVYLVKPDSERRFLRCCLPAAFWGLVAGVVAGSPFMLTLDGNWRFASRLDVMLSFLAAQLVYCLTATFHAAAAWTRYRTKREVLLEVLPHRLILDSAIVLTLWGIWISYVDGSSFLALFLMLLMAFLPAAIYRAFDLARWGLTSWDGPEPLRPGTMRLSRRAARRTPDDVLANPLLNYMRPWKRAKGAAVAQIFLALLVMGGLASLAFAIPNSMAAFILGGLIAVTAFVPWTFARFARRGTPEQIEELYLTLLTRRQVFYGSWLRAACFALLLGGVISLAPIAGLLHWTLFNSSRWDAGEIASVLTLSLCLMLLSVLALTKALRIWLLFDDRRWLLVPGVFLISIPEGIALLTLGLMALSWEFYMIFFYGLPIMIAWNYYIATKWGLELFYRQIDPPSLRDLFMGRYFRGWPERHQREEAVS